MRHDLTVGSLFSGVGGLDLGLEWAGLEHRWFCEADEFCRRILGLRWPGLPVYPDARTLPDDLEPVDLVAGGFPCQPVSLAGRGLAQDDPRWLWPAFERTLRLVRPRLVFVENVLGLANRGMADVLGGLAALGFDAAWTSFGAAHVGAPHWRRRVWIVAAHPERVALRVEPRGVFGLGWAGETLARFDGPARALADADSAREPQSPGVLAGLSRWVVDGGEEGGGDDVADAGGERLDGWPGGRRDGRDEAERREEGDHPRDGRGAPDPLADADGAGWVERGRARGVGGGFSESENGRGARADADGEGPPDGRGHRPRGGPVPTGFSGWWALEPDVGRVAHGVAGRVDRLRALGNGVVPQCAELVARRLIDVIDD